MESPSINTLRSPRNPDKLKMFQWESLRVGENWEGGGRERRERRGRRGEKDGRPITLEGRGDRGRARRRVGQVKLGRGVN